MREARLQDEKNRQNSIEVDDVELKTEWSLAQERVIIEARKAYTWAIENGIANEQARFWPPEGNTVSRLYMNGTIRSWIHYVELRSEHGTQKEHIEVAKAVGQAISEIFPLINN